MRKLNFLFFTTVLLIILVGVPGVFANETNETNETNVTEDCGVLLEAYVNLTNNYVSLNDDYNNLSLEYSLLEKEFEEYHPYKTLYAEEKEEKISLFEDVKEYNETIKSLRSDISLLSADKSEYRSDLSACKSTVGEMYTQRGLIFALALGAGITYFFLKKDSVVHFLKERTGTEPGQRYIGNKSDRDRRDYPRDNKSSRYRR